MPVSRSVYYLTYATLSLVAFYYMRLGPASQTAALHLDPLISGSAPSFRYPGQSTIIRQRYTGVKAVDGLLSTLVTAFLAGPAGWREDIRVQQVNFLSSWTSVLVVWSLESMRESNKWSLITFTSLWALLYQTVGGAVIVPLYLLFHTYTTSRATYATSSHRIPNNKARSLVPAVILGYLLPTAAMYYPFKKIDHTMLATAFWQPSPILVNILWAGLSSLLEEKPAVSGRNKFVTGRNQINLALIGSGVISAISHLHTLYLIVTSPNLSFQSIFIPQQHTGMALDSAVHFIFQIDYLVIFIATTIWALQNILDVKERSVGVGRAVLGLMAGVVVFGPAATLSAVWYWREGRYSRLGEARKAK